MFNEYLKFNENYNTEKEQNTLMRILVVFALALSILFLNIVPALDASAIKDSDLILTVIAEDSIQKKYLVVGAKCIVTDRFGNLLSYGTSNGAGLAHIPLRSHDAELDSRIVISCSIPNFEGTEILEIDEQRYIREEIEMTPLSYYVVGR